MNHKIGARPGAAVAPRVQRKSGAQIAAELAANPNGLWEIDYSAKQIRDLYYAVSGDRHELREAERVLREHGCTFAAANLSALRLLGTAEPDPRIEQIAQRTFASIHHDDRRLLVQTVNPPTDDRLRRRFTENAYSAIGGISVEHAHMATGVSFAFRRYGRTLTDSEEAQVVAEAQAWTPHLTEEKIQARIIRRISGLLRIRLSQEDAPPDEITSLADRARNMAVSQLISQGFGVGAQHVSALERAPTGTLLDRMLDSPGRPMLKTALVKAFVDAGKAHEEKLREPTLTTGELFASASAAGDSRPRTLLSV